MNETLFGHDIPVDRTADTITDAAPDLQMLPVDELHPDESQPRTEMEGLDTESEFRTIDGLAQSIRERGILQPLRVVARPSGGYLIQSGHRRHAAAKLAGLSLVPCILLSDDGDDVGKFIDQITENTQRKSMTSKELSLAVQKLKKAGLSQAEVSRKLGVNESSVSMLMRLLRLPANIKAAFENGLIESPRAAYDLERLPKPLQDHILSQLGTTPLTQSSVREAKAAWEANGLVARHPYQSPPLPQAQYASLVACLEDGLQDQYPQAAIERARDAFFGVGWRTCAPITVPAMPPPSIAVAKGVPAIEVAGLNPDDALHLLAALSLLTKNENPQSPLTQEDPTDQQIADWLNAEIKAVVRLMRAGGSKALAGLADLKTKPT
jgi:ParB/RepB/Spo0J family partition protein